MKAISNEKICKGWNRKEKFILCGFTSSGKTTIGKLLAQRLELPFFDTDEMLMQENQMTIPEIFEKGGETLFRNLEYDIARKVCELDPAVISTGGGMLTFARNGELLKKNGQIIYIDRPFEACYRSLSSMPDRPLFQHNTKEQLERLYLERKSQYMLYASQTVKNDSRPEDVVEEICSRYFHWARKYNKNCRLCRNVY